MRSLSSADLCTEGKGSIFLRFLYKKTNGVMKVFGHEKDCILYLLGRIQSLKYLVQKDASVK